MLKPFFSGNKVSLISFVHLLFLVCAKVQGFPDVCDVLKEKLKSAADFWEKLMFFQNI